MIVTLEHLRSIPGYGPKPGFCAGKSRVFFAAHGLDWSAFLRQGIDAQLLLDTDDALAAALVEWARQCEGGQ